MKMTAPYGYGDIVPLRKDHRVRLPAGRTPAFCRRLNAIAVSAAEFVAAAHDYPLVFMTLDGGASFAPAAVTGLDADSNLFVDANGDCWQAKYLPAFVRRYPFVFSSSADGNTFTLCIDESYPGVNREGRGERLFDEHSKPTPYVENVLKFLEQYQIEFRRTQAFCGKLLALGLLEPMRAQANLATGERFALTGFMAVNRERLKALSAEALADLAKTDALELLYLHLHSMRNFSGMMDRLGARRSAETGEAADGSPVAQGASAAVGP